MMKGLGVLLAFASAVVAVERFYSHPTYGNGIRAFIAAIQAGELFA
jgi:hypothetical protein